MNADKILSALGKGFLSVSDSKFIYGPYGRLLLRNIEDDWWKHCVVSSKYNVYPTKISDTSRTLRYLRDTNSCGLPFGLVSTETTDCDPKFTSILGLPLPALSRIMKVTTFGEKSSTKDLFYKKQRERKAWWRKFSSNPSRFVVMNSEKNENRDFMDIKAQFPGEDSTVEVISFGKAQSYLQDSEVGGSIGDSYVVEHATSLELAFLTLLFDGYAEDGESLHVHPKLAPYKALITADCGSNGEELLQLAVYLNSQLRADSLNTIVSSNSDESQTLRVPYVIVVDDESLKNGIVQVTSRLTTISEKVHITNLVQHIAACCA